MLKETLNKDLIVALKSGDKEKTGTLRLVLSALHNLEIEKRGKTGKDVALTDEDVLDVLKRESRKRKEAIELYQKGGRADLAGKEEAELGIIKNYLPPEMSEEEVNSLFTLANKLSAIVFECMKAEGTNIFTANGNAAGQMIPHVVVHIIPRWKDDKISFAWEGAKVDEKEMNDIQMNISKLVQEQLKEKVQRIEAVKSDDSFEEEERIP